MSSSTLSPGRQADPANPGGLRRLWQRSLPAYPTPARRYFHLALVVVASVLLYYQLYIQYAVAPAIMRHYGMSFTFFAWMSVIGNVVGAFVCLLAGLADRWGRANLVVYGLLANALLLLVLPWTPNRIAYLVVLCAVVGVEGVILVATPALMRDFSPQWGRGAAMGFWALGPVLGSLVTTVVTSLTLDTTTWQTQLTYAAVSGFVVFLVALGWLRELTPAIRDQVLVSRLDEAIVEEKARSAPAAETEPRRWRKTLDVRILGPAFGIVAYLLFYFSLVGDFVIYFTTVFGYSQQRANQLGNWYFATFALSLVVSGWLSDRLRVRKPVMFAGALGSIVGTAAFALLANRPGTGFEVFAVLFVFIGAFAGLTYSPWMAAYTETVERHNPAGTAVGLAAWGWILRIVVAAASVVTPLVVTSVTPLIEHGAEVQAAQARSAPAQETIRQHPALFAELARYAAGTEPADLLDRAEREVGADALAQVRAAETDLRLVGQYGPAVAEAGAAAPGQWQTWWWVCLGGQVVFLPWVFVIAGRWSPRAARRDARAHQLVVERQLARLGRA
jgi:MFS family permease